MQSCVWVLLTHASDVEKRDKARCAAPSVRIGLGRESNVFLR